MSDQPATYDHQSTTLLLCVPVMLGLAFFLAFVELFTHRNRGRSFCADVEAADQEARPLLRHRRRKSSGIYQNAKWWQFWRSRSNADAAQSSMRSPSTNQRSANYGTIDEVNSLSPRYPYEQVPYAILSNPSSFEKRYRLIRTLKCSNEGPVHLVQHRQTQKQFIIKQLPCQSTKASRPRWPIEAETMAKLSPHPNIIHLEKVDIQFPVANVIMKFCQKGDLMNYVSSIQEQAPAPFILHFISSMIDALAHIHFGPYPILHRDIKSQNIFLKLGDDDKCGLPTIVLADFGLARTPSKNVGLDGTNRYLAPEILALRDDITGEAWDQIGHHTPGTDMFGFAATLFDILALENFTPMTPENITEIFSNSSVSDRPEILDLLLKCLTTRERPTADTLVDLSNKYREELQAWYDAGNRIPIDEFPDAWEFDESENELTEDEQFAAYLANLGKPRSRKSEWRSVRPMAGREQAVRWPPV